MVWVDAAVATVAPVTVAAAARATATAAVVLRPNGVFIALNSLAPLPWSRLGHV